jgi:hypothetical protein
MAAAARDLALSSDKDGDNFTDMAYDSIKTIMKESLLIAIEAAEAAYKDHKPIRRIWDKAIAAWDDFEVVAHGILAKEAESLPWAEAEIRLLDFEAVIDDFIKAQKKVRKKLRYLRTKDEQDSLRQERQCHGGMTKASDESCGPPPGRVVPGDSQPDTSAQYHDRLVASKSCFLPPHSGCTVLGEDQQEAAQYQGGLRTPLEDLCTPEAAEASVLCQSGRMMTSESCLEQVRLRTPAEKLPPGCAVLGEDRLEAAQYQSRLRTSSEELCTPEATVLCQSGRMMTSESCLPPPGCAAAGEVQPEAAPGGDAGKLGRPRHTGGYQPEAADQYHDRLVASKSCFLPLGRAALGEDQPEAAQYQGRLRTPSEELCTPGAEEAAVLCQSRLAYQVVKEPESVAMEVAEVESPYSASIRQ